FIPTEGQLGWYLFVERARSSQARDEMSQEYDGQHEVDHVSIGKRWSSELFYSKRDHGLSEFGESPSRSEKFVHAEITKASQVKHGDGFKVMLKLNVTTKDGTTESVPLTFVSNDKLNLPATDPDTGFMKDPIRGDVYRLMIEDFTDKNWYRASRFQ